MKSLLFLAALIWNNAWINELDHGDITQYPEIIHRISVVAGPWSPDIVPYLAALGVESRRDADYEQSNDYFDHMDFVMSKNPLDLDTNMRAVNIVLWIPQDLACLQRVKYDLFESNTTACGDMRRYVADGLIRGLALLGERARHTGTVEDWTAVKSLAENIAAYVRGVDGPDYIYNVDAESSTVTKSPNMDIAPKYRAGQYRSVIGFAEQMILEAE